MNFVKKYSFVALALTPLISIIATPIVLVPAIIFSYVFLGSFCEGQDEYCMLGPGIVTLIIFDIIFAYIIGLLFYRALFKPSTKKLLRVALLLGIYFTVFFGVFFISDHIDRKNSYTKMDNVYEKEQELRYEDFTMVERLPYEPETIWQKYITENNLTFRYPDDFVIRDHQSPSNFYFNTSNTAYDAPNDIVANNNRFIAFNKMQNLLTAPLSDISEATLINNILHIFKTSQRPGYFQNVLNRNIEVVHKSDGTKIYYIEAGSYSEESVKYNAIYVLLGSEVKGYHAFETYTTFYEGNEIAKRIIENSF